MERGAGVLEGAVWLLPELFWGIVQSYVSSIFNPTHCPAQSLPPQAVITIGGPGNAFVVEAVASHLHHKY